MRYLRSFGRFWWNFIVGDDWRVAAGVAVALGLTFAARPQRRQRLVAAPGRHRAGSRRIAATRRPAARAQVISLCKCTLESRSAAACRRSTYALPIPPSRGRERRPSGAQPPRDAFLPSDLPAAAVRTSKGRFQALRRSRPGAACGHDRVRNEREGAAPDAEPAPPQDRPCFRSDFAIFPACSMIESIDDLPVGLTEVDSREGEPEANRRRC